MMEMDGRDSAMCQKSKRRDIDDIFERTCREKYGDTVADFSFFLERERPPSL